MKFINVIECADKNKFEKYAENLISQGFILSSSYCGFVNSEEYDFCSSYQGVFIRKQEDIKPMSSDFNYIATCCIGGCEYFNNPKGCTYVGEALVKRDSGDGTCIKDKDAITILEYNKLKS